MIEQGGTGATAAGPMLKRIWDGLLGADGAKPIIAAERPATTVPTIAPQVKISR
jgi:penicillin-binding protein 2